MAGDEEAGGVEVEENEQDEEGNLCSTVYQKPSLGEYERVRMKSGGFIYHHL